MKQAEDILTKWLNAYDMTIKYDKRGYDAIISAIKEAQNNALDEAANKAIATIYDSYMDGDCGDEIGNYSATVNKESILKLKV